MKHERLIPTSTRDRRTWRRLLAEASACAHHPLRDTGDLLAKAQAARRAVVPAPPYTRDNPFDQLLTLSLELANSSADERQARAGELAAAVEAATAHHDLGPKEPPPPEPRFRPDLDG